VVQPHSVHWNGDRPDLVAAFVMSSNLERRTDNPQYRRDQRFTA
jgi:hypothetical protein